VSLRDIAGRAVLTRCHPVHSALEYCAVQPALEPSAPKSIECAAAQCEAVSRMSRAGS
jgi:hypothetical protein